MLNHERPRACGHNCHFQGILLACKATVTSSYHDGCREASGKGEAVSWTLLALRVCTINLGLRFSRFHLHLIPLFILLSPPYSLILDYTSSPSPLIDIWRSVVKSLDDRNFNVQVTVTFALKTCWRAVEHLTTQYVQTLTISAIPGGFLDPGLIKNHS